MPACFQIEDNVPRLTSLPKPWTATVTVPVLTG